MRRALRTRRDGPRVFVSKYVVTDNALRVAESLVSPLRKAGASPRLAARAHLIFSVYVALFLAGKQVPGATDMGSRRGSKNFS